MHKDGKWDVQSMHVDGFKVKMMKAVVFRFQEVKVLLSLAFMEMCWKKKTLVTLSAIKQVSSWFKDEQKRLHFAI